MRRKAYQFIETIGYKMTRGERYKKCHGAGKQLSAALEKLVIFF